MSAAIEQPVPGRVKSSNFWHPGTLTA